MAVRKLKPTSAGRRFQTVSDFAEITRTTPEKSLTEGLTRKSGRNNNGRVTSRRRGGGHKRVYRLIDFKRDKMGIAATVAHIEYDPNRTARIALLHYADGEKRYILAPVGIKQGDMIEAGEASSKMKLTLKKLGLPQDVIRRASICLYEGEINMVIHADGGEAEVEVDMDRIVLRMTDTGPGIPDVEQAMQEGYSTAGPTARELGFGAGMGLPNMKRYSDEMTSETEVGKGTVVTVVIKIPQ